MRRTERPWARWDERVAAGERIPDMLRSYSDESLIELLAGGDPLARRYEVNLVMTELLNRIVRLRRDIEETTRFAETLVESMRARSQDGHRLIEQFLADVPPEAASRGRAMVDASMRAADEAVQHLRALRTRAVDHARPDP